MLLTFKTLQGQTFTLEVDGESKVRQDHLASRWDCFQFRFPIFSQVEDVKKKIESDKGKDSYPWEKQKLIYNGKVLVNEDPLSKYEINEKKFLVVMVPKPTAPPPQAAAPAAATPAPAAPSTTPAASEAAAKPADKKEDEKMETSEGEKKESSPTEEKKDESKSSSGGLQTSDLVVGEDFNRMVQNIMDMGYGRDEVGFALLSL